MIIGLCQRFGCLPSQLLAEPADLLRWVELVDLAHPPEADDG